MNLELYVQQLKEIEQSFGALLKQLPNKSEMDALLTDINQAGLGRGLQFELFKPATQERMADFYAELPISVRITGNYHDMGAFASDVAQLPRIVTLNDIGIVNDKGTLTMEATAKTFRYLTRTRSRSSARRRRTRRPRNEHTPFHAFLNASVHLPRHGCVARGVRGTARGPRSVDAGAGQGRQRKARSARRRSSPTSPSRITPSICPTHSSRARSSP